MHTQTDRRTGPPPQRICTCDSSSRRPKFAQNRPGARWENNAWKCTKQGKTTKQIYKSSTHIAIPFILYLLAFSFFFLLRNGWMSFFPPSSWLFPPNSVFRKTQSHGHADSTQPFSKFPLPQCCCFSASVLALPIVLFCSFSLAGLNFIHANSSLFLPSHRKGPHCPPGRKWVRDAQTPFPLFEKGLRASRLSQFVRPLTSLLFPVCPPHNLRLTPKSPCIHKTTPCPSPPPSHLRGRSISLYIPPRTKKTGEGGKGGND